MPSLKLQIKLLINYSLSINFILLLFLSYQNYLIVITNFILLLFILLRIKNYYLIFITTQNYLIKN